MKDGDLERGNNRRQVNTSMQTFLRRRACYVTKQLKASRTNFCTELAANPSFSSERRQGKQ